MLSAEQASFCRPSERRDIDGAIDEITSCCVLQMALASEGLNPTGEPWSLLGYLHRPSTEDEIKGITHWVVSDLDTEVRCLPSHTHRFIAHEKGCLPVTHHEQRVRY